MKNHSFPLGHTTSVEGLAKKKERWGINVGGIFMGNQLRPHARNMLIGIQARALTASHTVLTADTFLSVATARVSPTTEGNQSTFRNPSKSPGPSTQDN